MADFGFVGDAYTAPSIYQDAQELINWFPEQDLRKAEGQRGVISLYPTPGLITKVAPTVAPVRAMRVMPGGATFLAVVGSGVYSVNASYAATLVGSLVTSTGYCSIADNGVSAYIVDGTNRYSYVIATGVFATIGAGDGAFTGGGDCDEQDTFIFYTRPGSNQWGCTSALSTSSPALSFSSAISQSDNLVGLISSNGNVYLLGERSYEAWSNVGAFPFPFQSIPGTGMYRGCAAVGSIARFGDGFAFLSADDRGQGTVQYMVGYTINRISTHSVENSLVGQTIFDAIAYTYQIEGHEFYVLNFPTADITWVFDLATKMWHKWLSVDGTNTYHRHRGNCGIVFQGVNLIGDYANGKIYQLSLTTYDEAGSTIRRLRRCPHIVSDFDRVFHSELQIQFQPGVGLITGQGSTPQVMLRWSNDGGSTWSTEHWVSIGAIGKYKWRAIWRRLGYARDRIYEVSISDPVKAVVVSANLKAAND